MRDRRPSPTSCRQLTLDDPQASAALNLILGGSARDSAASVADRLRPFHADCARRRLSPDLLFAVYQGRQLLSACVALVSPGAAALMLAPPVSPDEQVRTAAGQALAAARQASPSRGLVLLQFLQSPEEAELAPQLEAAGFHKLTTLIYMQRDPRLTKQNHSSPLLHWTTFDSSREPFFCQVLAKTYERSLDCPELSGLRQPSAILASHRSAGEFDPNLWWVASRGAEPVGVLLLAPLPGREILEIVYVGVVRGARGAGIADSLLDHALTAARHKRAQTLALAMDERNEPARRLYARWAFAEIGRRVAWIATNTFSEGCAPASAEQNSAGVLKDAPEGASQRIH